MYQSQISKEVFEFLNKVRQNPKIAIPILRQHLKYFNQTVLNLPGRVGLETKEGPRAYYDCIDFLEKLKPMPVLTYDLSLEQACLDHVIDIGPKGITGHIGSDGSQSNDRMKKYGQWLSTMGENISYGQFSGEDVVIQLIVDDGDPSRGHRNNCFNSNYKVVGIAFGEHAQHETICVIDFAGGFTPNSSVSQCISKTAYEGELGQTSDKLDGSKQMTKQDLLEIEQQLRTNDGFFSEMPSDCVKMTKSIVTKQQSNTQTTTTTSQQFFMANGSTRKTMDIDITIQVVMGIVND